MNKEELKKIIRDGGLEYFNLYEMTGDTTMDWEKEMNYLGEYVFRELKKHLLKE